MNGEPRRVLEAEIESLQDELHQEFPWRNEFPAEEGWYWYWHPDIVEAMPMRVLNIRTDTEYRWECKPDRYAKDGNEWWRPMGYDLDGPRTPDELDPYDP